MSEKAPLRKHKHIQLLERDGRTARAIARRLAEGKRKTLGDRFKLGLIALGSGMLYESAQSRIESARAHGRTIKGGVDMSAIEAAGDVGARNLALQIIGGLLRADANLAALVRNLRSRSYEKRHPLIED